MKVMTFCDTLPSDQLKYPHWWGYKCLINMTPHPVVVPAPVGISLPPSGIVARYNGVNGSWSYDEYPLSTGAITDVSAEVMCLVVSRVTGEQRLFTGGTAIIDALEHSTRVNPYWLSSNLMAVACLIVPYLKLVHNRYN